VIVITGAIDIVANEKTAYIISNGNPMMSDITGSGCMLTALIAAYIVANGDRVFEATAAAVCAMGIAGELAFERLKKTGGGNSTYRNYLIDAIYELDGETLIRGAKYEIK
jgi:hydroxyethylthiazole kinase